MSESEQNDIQSQAGLGGNNASAKRSFFAGCLGCGGGCLGCGGLVVVIMLVGGFWFSTRIFNDKPLEPSSFVATDEQLEEMRTVYDEAKAKLDEKDGEVVLELSEDEFNTLGILVMEENSDIHVFDGTIDGEKISVRFSAKDKGSGKFINMKFSGNVKIIGGKAENFEIDDASVGNFSVGSFLNGDSATMQFKQHTREKGIEVEDLYVEDGVLHLKFKKK
jgi:hypothetical protein